MDGPRTQPYCARCEYAEIVSVACDSGVHNFAPRIGIAYAPTFEHGILKLIFGDSAGSSIRASYGIFYTAFTGLSAGVMYAVPPFGYNYLPPQPPLFVTPFINAADGGQNINPFPLTFPTHSVSAKNPNTWPQKSSRAPTYKGSGRDFWTLILAESKNS